MGDGGGSEVRIFACITKRNTGRMLKKLVRVVTYGGGVNVGRGDRQRHGGSEMSQHNVNLFTSF